MRVLGLFVAVLTLAVAVAGCSHDPDADMPTNDPIIGKPAETGGKDPNARPGTGSEPGGKPAGPSKGDYIGK